MNHSALLALLLACAPQVNARTATALVEVESGFNPYAIGVVGGALRRQPHSRAEALATARALHAAGWRYSVGLGQIHVTNLDRLGLALEDAFEPCTNLAAMQTLLSECYERAQATTPTGQQDGLRRALSCYYSGDFDTGVRDGYVRRVALAAGRLR